MRRRRHLFNKTTSINEMVKQQAKEKERARVRRRRSTDNPNRTSDKNIDHMDTPQFENVCNAADGVVFGVYGMDDWVTNSFLRAAVLANKSTISREGTWIVEAGWEMYKWVMEISELYNFTSMDRALVQMGWGLLEVSVSRGKLAIELNGETKPVLEFMEKLDKQFKRAENLIEWVYSPDGHSISVPLNYRAALPGAYPWLPKEIGSYIDDYLNSEASVLILIGAPGTGKTTFIKNLIHRSGGNAKVTYDERVMSGDSLFAHFIESETKFMIMEDADTFLAKREDGNTMMHRFLNVSDGLISAKDKKLVFSTNLPSIRDIDAALLRPGRCFDIVEFRPLTRAEAQVVAKPLGIELPDGSEFTLGELFNVQPSGESKSIGRRVGFA